MLHTHQSTVDKMCLLKVRAAARLLGPGRTSSRLTTSRSVAALATGAGESSGPLNRRRALLAAGGAALAGGLTPPTSRPAIAAAAGKKIDVQRLLDEVTWPPTPPFEGDDFKRFDESDDAFFYDSPRFGKRETRFFPSHPIPIPIHLSSHPSSHPTFVSSLLIRLQSPTSTTWPSRPTGPSWPPISSPPPAVAPPSSTCALPGSRTTRNATAPPASWASA